MSSAWADVSLAVNVLLKLGLVLALVYGSLYLLRRWQSGGLASARRQLTVLETTRLAPRQALHLVRVGDRVWLVGATDQAVSLLGELPAGQDVAAGEEAAPAKAPGLPEAASFLAVLRARLPGQAKRIEAP